MLVYRNQTRSVNTGDKLADIRALVRGLERSEWDHARALELVIEFGELEAGIADALSPLKDVVDSTTCAFRKASLLLGRAYYHSWRQSGAASAWLTEFARVFEVPIAHDLPERISVGVPEGYAYYSLYPEMYMEAAEQFVRQRQPRNAVVIGIRSIGTSESAVVGAALEEAACVVHAYTVRPRGHPFDRYLAVDTALEEEWRSLGEAFFLVVDEGPGLSGSSFICVTQELAALGIPDGQIVLFPSWVPKDKNLVSPAARTQWHRYDKYVATFEQVELESGRLPISQGPYDDLSAGKWRSLVYPAESRYPAVHPHHERRKYLQTCSNPDDPKTPVLWKFAGLGRYGREKLERAKKLAEAGWSPRALGLENGLLALEWVQGAPLAPSSASQDLLDAMARYLAFLEDTFPAQPSVDYDALLEMILVNVSEGLGQEWHSKLGGLDKFRNALADAGATALDARMLPHEWLAVSGRFCKTDSVDHHDDHFYPGCQNIAWDLAGTCVEFDLAPAEQSYLVDRYHHHSGDRNANARLPFYLIAYLSFRLGYATMAAQALGPSPEGERFQRLMQRYAKRLRKEIEPL